MADEFQVAAVAGVLYLSDITVTASQLAAHSGGAPRLPLDGRMGDLGGTESTSLVSLVLSTSAV